jgi:hypothetical protein
MALDADARLGSYVILSPLGAGGMGEVDRRFAASVLLAAGLGHPRLQPEMALMIGGRDDFLMPIESSQRPLFRLLGAPEADKRLAVLDGGHIPSDRREIIREVLDWLDRHLGPVGGAR